VGGRGSISKEGRKLKGLHSIFRLASHNTSIRTEFLAGLTTFFTISYIIIVNSSIISETGIPFEAALLGTIFTSCLSCLLMGLWANAPIIIVPGMGVNAFFTFTMVHEMGLSWQEALTAVTLSGMLFTIITFTPLATWLSSAVPTALKKGMTVGIGLLITFIGLQKGGLIISNEQTFVSFGNLHQPKVWITLFSLALLIILFVRKVQGAFLITLVLATVVALIADPSIAQGEPAPLSLEQYVPLLGNFALAGLGKLTFWVATFTLTMILVFENMGLLQGLLTDKQKFPAAFQASALSNIMAGLLGTSATICALESATGTQSGGRTGLTTITAGGLFLLSLILIPYLKWIPESAVAAIMIVVGGLMMQEVQAIPFGDFTEGLPAFITFAFIPFTYSIPTGIAFGFITYAILKIAAKRTREVPISFFIIALLFMIQLGLHG
jgi:adenine/guanine/hypoxanthine permease